MTHVSSHRKTFGPASRDARRGADLLEEPRASRQAGWCGGPIVGGRAYSNVATRRVRSTGASGTACRARGTTASSGSDAGVATATVAQQAPTHAQCGAPSWRRDSCEAPACACVGGDDTAERAASLCASCIEHTCSAAGSPSTMSSQRPHTAQSTRRRRERRIGRMICGASWMSIASIAHDAPPG